MTLVDTEDADPAAAGRPRRGHTARWIAAAVAVVGAALVVLLATRPPEAATEVDTPLVGQRAPALDGPTLAGGSFHLASLRGRWVVLNFFASWCPPCQQEEPDLVAFAYAHRAPTAAALVGVVFNDSAAAAHAFMRSEGATWPAVVDGGGQIALAYGVVGPPETFIVAPDGTVVVHLDGPVTASELDHWLARARQGTA